MKNAERYGRTTRRASFLWVAVLLAACGGPADQILQMLADSDKITFLVGTRINIAHQDPTLPVELEIRRNVVKKIKYLLETKWLKDVDITYL
mgnify:CR=1 FL=1